MPKRILKYYLNSEGHVENVENGIIYSVMINIFKSLGSYFPKILFKTLFDICISLII